VLDVVNLPPRPDGGNLAREGRHDEATHAVAKRYYSGKIGPISPDASLPELGAAYEAQQSGSGTRSLTRSSRSAAFAMRSQAIALNLSARYRSPRSSAKQAHTRACRRKSTPNTTTNSAARAVRQALLPAAFPQLSSMIRVAVRATREIRMNVRRLLLGFPQCPCSALRWLLRLCRARCPMCPHETTFRRGSMPVRLTRSRGRFLLRHTIG
jgi:hypothetical protein